MTNDCVSFTEAISFAANLVTIAGLPFAIYGLFAVAKQMRHDRLAASSGAIAEMRASIMARVERLGAINDANNVKGWKGEFLEFANDLEMACAIYLDGQMTGRTGKLAKGMICDFLDMINDDEDMREELERAIHAPDTFTNIKDFRATVSRHEEIIQSK
jgi:hypothetical protein